MAVAVRLDTAVVNRKQGKPSKLSPHAVRDQNQGLGPLTVTGKGIVSAVPAMQADILRIHTGAEGGNALWMQGGDGGTPLLWQEGSVSTPQFSDPAEATAGRSVMFEGGGATPSTGEESLKGCSSDGKPTGASA